MPQNNSHKTNQEASLRAKQIKAYIRKLKQKIQKIYSEGEVAPSHCHVIRYQTKKNDKIYWYYKLQAVEPLFPTATDKNKKSKYLYLGKAGSEAHLDAVDKVTRRGLIDELERTLNSLQESYLDVCFGGETEPGPSSETKGLKEE
ncbi:MAG: hypothetical protein F6K21_28890 [Symploca sp. SIO2D2]|nr:hypothetical protein [Symploca sp. SIO2D2]